MPGHSHHQRRNPVPRKVLRCAIYTRKSSEEGLEQSFNSLDAQRDACEAFITSQKHEGWVALPDAYDDGGFSGGSMERPALAKLLADIGKGSIDVVVVYKVDRLTRSLADFARLTDRFDSQGVSFVSVTQQFNTSTSMGRLTLNVLLSFAQFEREVAGERIRDKIALSKKRGMWMGGLPPLGYDRIDRNLVVNEAEAATVRAIFERYLEAGSIPELKRQLDQTDIVSKRRVFENGRKAGGVPLGRGAIYHILRNRLYRGEITYRGAVYPGNHPAIIDEALWNAVQSSLEARSARARGAFTTRSSTSPLAGLVFDSDGQRLTPSTTHRRSKRYRYYISASLARDGASANGIRVPGHDLEHLVFSTIGARLCDPAWVMEHLASDERDPSRLTERLAAASALSSRLNEPDASEATQQNRGDLVSSLIHRITVGRAEVEIELNRRALAIELDMGCRPGPSHDGDEQSDAIDDDTDPLRITVPARTLRTGKQIRLIVGEVTSEERRIDPDLVRLVTDAHRWFEDLRSGRSLTIAEIATRDRQQASHVSRTIALAFLAPDIVAMILEGRQPPTLTPERLRSRNPGLPLSWAKQRELLLG